MLIKLRLTNCWRKLFHQSFLVSVISAMLATSHVATALDISQNTQIHGFVMQSFVKSDNNNYFGGIAEKGSLKYTEIGINASMKLSSKLKIASQLLSRRAGQTDNGEIKLDFAVIDYRLIDKAEYGFGLRVGRIKNPVGFYNETRDVSFTRASIVLPQSIYFERTRDVMISSDSLHLYGFTRTVLGPLNGQLAVGLPRVTGTNTQYALLGGIRPGEFKAKPSMVGRLSLEALNSRMNIGLSYVNLFMDYKPASTELADPQLGFNGNGDIQFRMAILSVMYNLKNWSFMFEYAQRKIEAEGIIYIPPVVNNKTGESFYFQSIFHLNYKWNLIARYDVLYSDKNDRSGNQFAQDPLAQASGLNNFSRFSKDAMVGVQYNINRHWMTRVEFHEIDGTAWLPIQDNLSSAVTVRKWRMLNASISYRF